MVWDAEKAVLEVEHFEDAVILLAQAGVTVWLQGLGWLGGVAGLLVMAAPRFCKRMVESTLFDFPDAVLRTLGVVNIAFGLFLGWVAFAVL